MEYMLTWRVPHLLPSYPSFLISSHCFDGFVRSMIWFASFSEQTLSALKIKIVWHFGFRRIRYSRFWPFPWACHRDYCKTFQLFNYRIYNLIVISGHLLFLTYLPIINYSRAQLNRQILCGLPKEKERLNKWFINLLFINNILNLW